MKKNICKTACVIFAVLAFVSVYCALTVSGSGFLDLSNIARYVFIGFSVISVIVSVLTGIYGFKNK